MKRKGISPLIAAVILIASVVAVAGIVSNFLTSFTKGRQGEIEEKGESAIDCSVAYFEIDPDTVNFDPGSNTTTLTIEVKGESELKDFKMTLYDSNKISNQVTGKNGTFNPGDVVLLNGTVDRSVLNLPLTRIRVSSRSCSAISDSVENDTSKGWVKAELSERFENL
jgi:flagellin-like protein